MDFEIREAMPGDFGAVLQLDKEAFGPDAWTIPDFLGVFSFRTVKKFTALVNGKFAGFAASEYDRTRKAVCLMTLAVRSEYRRRGIGTALLMRCEEAFQAGKYFLNADAENTAAIRLYERAGYRQTGVDRAYYMNGHDAVLMEKTADEQNPPL